MSLLSNLEACIVNTGNILSINDITKNPGQNPAEELAEVVKITLSEYQNNGYSPHNSEYNISRKGDDLASKMSEHELADLKIGIKLFLTIDRVGFLHESIEKAFAALNVDSVHNIIISFKSDNRDELLEKLQTIWKVLEEYVKNKKVQQIGIADIEENTFQTIYEWSEVKPSIIQINLASCCVVPPTLQTYCKDHEILLLTHSDPTDILPLDVIENIFAKKLNLNWAVRYLVHIKCRGVLTSKGYLLSLSEF